MEFKKEIGNQIEGRNNFWGVKQIEEHNGESLEKQQFDEKETPIIQGDIHIDDSVLEQVENESSPIVIGSNTSTSFSMNL
ncbi:hypothetical protein TSUD_349570 [Trifolium subterraneum]|uniref:Uncharacterized protein n=1 Tax=Trifolium subterraneum TaxID=3900 RepID=A0A2Z6P733_TRISU|nr:hypothetical protein TSUD_349570 [Trifolium subterraneum]